MNLEALMEISLEQRVQDAVETTLAYFTTAPEGQRDFSFDKAWTVKLFNVLAEVGQKQGYTICSSKLASYKDSILFGEWLFDQCWLKWAENDEQSRIKDVAIVLESEWSRDPIAILCDFEKLPLARADLRVMVFQQRSRVAAHMIFERLRKTVEGFTKSVPGDRYLFCAYIMKEREFIYEKYQYVRTGKLENR
jgi:hypothetical protein